MPKPTLEQVLAYAAADLDAPKPPSPWDIALSMGAAILSAGRYGDDLPGAMGMAWRCVLPFYQGQKAYFEEAGIMQAIAVHAAENRDGMSAVEARAYVTGGETGDLGEGGSQPTAFQYVQPPPLTQEEIDARTARQVRISECDQAMFAADRALQEAQGGPVQGRAKRVEKAQQAWNAAAAAQSAAHGT